MDAADALDLLRHGDVAMVGRMPWSSNATFLVEVCRAGQTCRAIYKPIRGERRLWDFEPGLHRREVAAYELSEATGFGFVPPTVLRDGPLGEGSLQLFLEVDHQHHYFTMYEADVRLHDQLRAVAMFDIIANNTDRKSGHCLLDGGGKVWSIDHGLCFSAEFKLRTVIWEFGGEKVAPALLDVVRPLATAVPSAISELLHETEVAAIRRRAAAVVERGAFPVDRGGHRYPWPLV